MNSTEPPAHRRRGALSLRRFVGLLAVAVLLVGGALVVRVLAERVSDDGPELYGSAPPADAHIPALHEVDGIEPGFPDSWATGTADGPLLLIATCLACGAGNAYGSALERMPWDSVPDTARIHVIALDGRTAAWQRRWGIDDRVHVHRVTEHATDAITELLQVDPRYGHARLIDSDGTWRASYPSGSALPAGMAADLRLLVED